MYIESIIFIIILLLITFWTIWYAVSRKWNERRYKPENDRGKIGEEHRQEFIREGKSDPSKSIGFYDGQRQPARQFSLPPTVANNPGEDGHGTGKTGSSNGKSPGGSPGTRGKPRKFKNPFKKKKK